MATADVNIKALKLKNRIQTHDFWIFTWKSLSEKYLKAQAHCSVGHSGQFLEVTYVLSKEYIKCGHMYSVQFLVISFAVDF